VEQEAPPAGQEVDHEHLFQGIAQRGARAVGPGPGLAEAIDVAAPEVGLEDDELVGIEFGCAEPHHRPAVDAVEGPVAAGVEEGVAQLGIGGGAVVDVKRDLGRGAGEKRPVAIPDVEFQVAVGGDERKDDAAQGEPQVAVGRPAVRQIAMPSARAVCTVGWRHFSLRARG
jgi:hypothetical protein